MTGYLVPIVCLFYFICSSFKIEARGAPAPSSSSPLLSSSSSSSYSFSSKYLDANNLLADVSSTTAAGYMRYIVQNENYFGSLSTWQQQLHPIRPSPFPFVTLEDYCPTANQTGQLMWLFPTISASRLHLMTNPNASFAIQVSNCSSSNYAHFPWDPIACYRFSLSLSFYKVMNVLSPQDKNADLQYFLQHCHPAAVDWIEKSGHIYELWSANIEDIFYLGGYGGLHYLGPIEVATYYNATPTKPP